MSRDYEVVNYGETPKGGSNVGCALSLVIVLQIVTVQRTIL